MFKELFDKLTGGHSGRDLPLKLVNQADFAPHIREALVRPLSRIESNAIRRIEEMRTACEADQREIVVMDYGAGSPRENRSAEAMEAGVSKRQRVGEICRIASKSAAWGEFLFRLVRHFRPKSCVEMGTCVGVSGAYIASALALNGQGRLNTLEGSSSLAEVARVNIASLGLANLSIGEGRFSDTLRQTLESSRPVDFIFIDGHHDEQATLAYFQQIRPFLDQRNVLVFDDIDWSDGMRSAWRKIQATTQGHTLGNVGICIDVRPR